jgi:hypothetical protein
MQQIQCIDRESREQPHLHEKGGIKHRSAAEKIHATEIKDSRDSAFSNERLWTILANYL